MRFPVFWALAGGLGGLVVFRIVVRRRLVADGALPGQLRRLDLVLLLVGMAGVVGAILPYQPQITEAAATLFMTAMLVVGTIIVLPRDKIARPAATFMLVEILLLARQHVFDYAAKAGLVLEHLVPIVYLAALTTLFISAGLFLLKNVRFSSTKGGDTHTGSETSQGGPR